MQKTIYDIVRKAEQDDVSGNTTISKYVTFDLRENIEKIDAYLNSKHISGDTDSMGREKPFFNIVTAAVNIWYRATDIDRKNIRIRASKSSDVISAFLATVHVQEWMRKVNFGKFLNDWGRSLARYGSSVVKFVEKDGELYAEVIPWNRIIVDPIRFEGNPKIEVLELTASELRKREGYDKEQVKALIEAKEVRTTIDGQTKDTRDDFIKLYEVHGEFPLSYLTGKDKDDDTFVQQMHVISFVEGKERGTFDEFTLVKGREAKDPYMITHLIKEDGRVQGIGAVEHLFEAQWMMNHSVKAIKDQLDLASKLIFQTSDGSFVGQNALTAIESGDILIHKTNEPLTQINNGSHDISSLQSFGNQWKALAQEITSTPDALMGNNAPSGTAWRQVEALQQEAHSLFELMTENKGLDIEDMFRTHVIPHIKKKMDSSEEVSATLESHDIKKIDSIYINSVKVNFFKEKLLEGELVTPEILNEVSGQAQNELSSLGNTRFFKPSDVTTKTWKEIFKDLEWDVEVDVTGESKDTQSNITTLTTVLQTIAGNPMVLENPNAKLLFNKIIEQTGAISPIELQSTPTPSLAGGGTPQVGDLSANQ